MDENGLSRKIRALTAIVQTMMTEFYGALGKEDAATSFRELVADGDPLATAISNNVAEHEIDEALTSTGRLYATHEEALRAKPVYRYLTEEQRERGRIMRVAEDAIDQACTPGVADPERAILDAILGDLAAHRSEMPDNTAAINELVQHLPEPWRRHARKGLQIVRDQKTTT